jgi:YggT family protein
MSILSYILIRVAQIVDTLLSIYIWVIIIRAIISWVEPNPYNPIVQILTKVTEPVLRPIRKLVPPYKIGIDFSPFIAVMIIMLLQWVLRYMI